MASRFSIESWKRCQSSWYHRKTWVDLRLARRECDEPRGWSHHEERHDDHNFDCDGHVDRVSEHTPKERHRDLVVDKEMPDVLEKNVDIHVMDQERTAAADK